MSLEMKVYRDVNAYEAKAMFGLKWRQLGALCIGVPLVFGLFFGITALYMTAHGFEYEGFMQIVSPDEDTQRLIESGTTVAMLVAMLAFIPFAIYGWLRPKGLMPEKYIPYWHAYQTTPKELCYGRDDAGNAAGEPVDHRRRGNQRGGARGSRARGQRGAAGKQEPRRRRKVDEHAAVPPPAEARDDQGAGRN
ncbi:MAG: PrgI family protein [Brevibacterium sp.]|nr:PrgI family protein [Brevibacterium sp.]